MIKRVELLVHAGAPSGRTDDSRYIAQATSYLAFHGERVNLRPHASLALPAAELPPTTLAPAPSGNYDSSTFLEETQLAYDALESQLATSSLLIPAVTHSSAASQRPCVALPPVSSFNDQQEDGLLDRTFATDADGAERSSAEAQHETIISTPDSQTEEHAHSSYLKSPILNRSRKTRRPSCFDEHQPAPSKRVRSTYIPLLEYDRIGLAYVGSQPLPSIEQHHDIEANASHDSLAAAEITSELPTTYSLSDITTESGRAQVRLSSSYRSPAVEELEHEPEAVVEQSSEDGVGVDVFDPSTEKLQSGRETRAQQDATPMPSARNIEQNNLLADSDAQGSSPMASKTHNIDVPHQPQATLSNLSTSVRPPEPRTSQAKFTTHITESLRFLAENLDVDKRYKPVTVSRDIRPLERGYWLFSCSSWDLATQIEFWQFIETLIQRGNAGWGVWCTRGGGDEGITTAATTTTSGAAESIGTVKVFCWGEVVKHIYLMLYVASMAKVRKLGLQWIDAEGKVVVQMSKV